MAVDYVCSLCGGNTVTRDAWAEWDTAAQDWTLGAAFDSAYCHDCEEEPNLVEVDLDTRGPPAAEPAGHRAGVCVWRSGRAGPEGTSASNRPHVEPFAAPA